MFFLDIRNFWFETFYSLNIYIYKNIKYIPYYTEYVILGILSFSIVTGTYSVISSVIGT